MKKPFFILLSWLFVLSAPACIMLKLSPEAVQAASVFTVLGMAINYMVQQGYWCKG